MKRRTDRTRNGLARVPMFPGKSAAFADPDPAADHRAFQAGAVLSLVNALRYASTRPAAGPSGIDDACARHDLGYCAMAGFLTTRARREKPRKASLTRDFRRRMLMYRVCAPTAHPPHRTQCMQSAFPVVALRARFKRTHHNIASGCYAVTLRESVHLTRDQADSLRRVVSKTKRR